MKDKRDTGVIPTLSPFQLDDYMFTGRISPDDDWYNNFHVERIENYKQRLKLPILPHRRSVDFFMFVTNGHAVRSKLLNNYDITTGHCFFLPADMTTAFDFLSDDAAGFYCHFNREIFQQSMLKADLAQDFPFFSLSANPLIKVVNPVRIEQLFQLLYEENSLKQKKRMELIAIYLLGLLTEIKLQVTASGTENSPKNAAAFLTKRYKDALSRFVYEKSSVAEFAEWLNVTPNHLNKSVKLVTGKSAHDLLSEMRILEAKVLLKQTDLGIGEIAFRIGKCDHSDFSRFFRLMTGVSPNQYRQGKND